MNIVLLIAICIAVIMCCVYVIQLLSPIKEFYGDLYKSVNTIPRGYVEVDDIIEKKDLAKYEKLSYLVLTIFPSFSFMYHILTEDPQGTERKVMALLVLTFLASALKGFRALQIVKAIKKHYGV